jgi:hypothetical protein
MMYADPILPHKHARVSFRGPIISHGMVHAYRIDERSPASSKPGEFFSLGENNWRRRGPKCTYIQYIILNPQQHFALRKLPSQLFSDVGTTHSPRTATFTGYLSRSIVGNIDSVSRVERWERHIH